ncbi:cupin domain-containing protein [Actinomadura scrupuli]|uniref:cupin domain-containing protein n=1 Tax=Actinomadura scrupuli TaxID=559629 RepID=UPI003D956557
MPVIHAPEAVVHELHGARFTAYANPASGSRELCAWRLEVPAGSRGLAHTVSREEVLLLMKGALSITIDGTMTPLAPGDAAVVPAGATLCVDNDGEEPAAAWVTTSVGLEAVLADGTRIAPPWTR